ncbi:conjugative transposon protein TraN [Proteiniphilum sp. UBA5346]|uniref:conjugative transposon protein TraN n=1 Tax=Proteiniphilum sp. UBA5346 TaxID=1947277 RepID=UPI00257BD182|nr:conjugative transposon protein TraN [Proteiniphilum sp. UBA5346]
MKQCILLVIVLFGALSLKAQSPHFHSPGDVYPGLARSIPPATVAPPYGLEVTFEKTVHLIFPAQIRYVDLGSNNLVAGKAEDAENVLRVKAAVRNFMSETNLSVICNDGSFYTFNVKYAEEPQHLSIEMGDLLHPGDLNMPLNKTDIYFNELGNESPILVNLIMKTIWQNDKREIKHVGSKKLGVQFLLRGLYTHHGLLYFHTLVKNQSQMGFRVEFITFKVVDKKAAKRTAIHEQVLEPLRTYNDVASIGGNQTVRSVYVLEQFTLPGDKQLIMTLFEQNGGRHQSFVVESEDLVRAKSISNLKLKLQ